jgi:hypothetical protein
MMQWYFENAADWGGEENRLLRQKKEAEFLVAEDVVSENICGFVCYNEIAKQRLLEIGVNKIISIQSQAYY